MDKNMVPLSKMCLKLAIRTDVFKELFCSCSLELKVFLGCFSAQKLLCIFILSPMKVSCAFVPSALCQM